MRARLFVPVFIAGLAGALIELLQEIVELVRHALLDDLVVHRTQMLADLDLNITAQTHNISILRLSSMPAFWPRWLAVVSRHFPTPGTGSPLPAGFAASPRH
jgi:hypothetical protein